jgi:hypothetical protein
VADQILLSKHFKEWMSKFLFNSEAYPDIHHGAAIKANNYESEPGFVDKLVELWKLHSSLKSVKSQIADTRKSKSLHKAVAALTTRKRWVSKIYNDLLAPRLSTIEKSVREMLPNNQYMYENIVMTYNLLKIIIDRDYEVMINKTLWVNFIRPILTGRCNQPAI